MLQAVTGISFDHPVFSLLVMLALFGLIHLESWWRRPKQRHGYYVMTVCWTLRFAAMFCVAVFGWALLGGLRFALATSKPLWPTVFYGLPASVCIVLAVDAFYRRVRFSEDEVEFSSALYRRRRHRVSWSEVTEIRDHADRVTLYVPGGRYNVYFFMVGLAAFQEFATWAVRRGRRG